LPWALKIYINASPRFFTVKVAILGEGTVSQSLCSDYHPMTGDMTVEFFFSSKRSLRGE
jgi:hypothetical protein